MIFYDVIMHAGVRILIVFVTACAVLLFAAGSLAQSRQRSQQGHGSLQEVTEQIEQQKKKLEQVEREEAEVISRLNAIEKSLLQENREYQAIVQDIRHLQDDIHETRTRVQTLQQESARYEQVLQKRLSALYKYNRRSGLRILLSSHNYNDLLRTRTALSLIVQRDKDMLSRSLERLKQLRLEESRLQERRTELMEARRDVAESRDRIRAAQQQRSSYLSRIQQEKSLQVKALRELEEYSRQLQQIIDELPSERREYAAAGIAFSQMRGRLEFPVKGEILTRFGRQEHPELQTHTYQKGINIRANAGTPIRAVHDGRVVFADWFKGYGYLMIIDHGEHYYSLSAHAAELLKQVGDLVFAGETIARVGDTSSTTGTGLYFEIRHHGQPQDPLRWLKQGGNR